MTALKYFVSFKILNRFSYDFQSWCQNTLLKNETMIHDCKMFG